MLAYCHIRMDPDSSTESLNQMKLEAVKRKADSASLNICPDVCTTSNNEKPTGQRKKPVAKRRRDSESGESKLAMMKKRRKSDFVIPRYFPLGGTITDPLNLNELMKHPELYHSSSPLPGVNSEVDILYPKDITDPLALNYDVPTRTLPPNMVSPHKGTVGKRKQKPSMTNRHLVITPPQVISIESSMKSDVDCAIAELPALKLKVAKGRKKLIKMTVDEIVSPVIPPGTRTVDKRLKKVVQPSKMPDKLPNFKQCCVKYEYGNYNRYYGYRHDKPFIDSRLSGFKASWFKGKSVLDIGCNIGHVTLAIARDFSPLSIKGIDIDSGLIGIARKNVKHYPSNDGSCSLGLNVSFQRENYVPTKKELENVHAEYDCILLLSTSKWIHLNWGDEGLLNTFMKVYKQLRPGGLFVFEPQGWTSYTKKKKISEKIYRNYFAIKMLPHTFVKVLTEQVGFVDWTIISKLQHGSKGFVRPIYLFTKLHSDENQTVK